MSDWLGLADRRAVVAGAGGLDILVHAVGMNDRRPVLETPDDLVGPVLLLCSDRSAFVTGQVLYIDGGRTLV